MADLRRLAAYKYDDYEGFAAGELFFESFARWLGQFGSVEARRRLVEFVRSEMLFISRDELNHAIACVYPDFMKRALVARAAEELGVSAFKVREVVASETFRSLRRKTLYLGLSDGARLDRLRRASPELSHEQFWLSPELGPHAVSTMAEKLAEAIDELGLAGEPKFRHVVLVDDFYGSGTSLLHRKDDGTWGGKLHRARIHLNEDLRNGESPLLEDDADVTVVIYVASAQAEAHIREVLGVFEPTWQLHVVQQLPADVSVTDAALLDLSGWFFDDILIDKHKKQRVPLGYKAAALPLVLHHNTPNNSISPLWADSTDRTGGQNRHALFPRYERHHVDRP
ncbi:MAG: hypothetical protein ABIX10_02350 [Acidimicrobiales bacterium]